MGLFIKVDCVIPIVVEKKMGGSAHVVLTPVYLVWRNGYEKARRPRGSYNVCERYTVLSLKGLL